MSVIVGFIPTEVGYRALRAARIEAERRGVPLIVVNVIREGESNDPRHAGPGQLDAAREELRRACIRTEVQQVTAEDDITEALLQVVDSERGELLVIGVRREKEMARHLLGTTAQRLLIDAPCDVLAV